MSAPVCPKSNIKLVRPLVSAFSQVLTDAMQMQSLEATAEARACSASVSVWRIWNMIERSSVPKKLWPEWAKRGGSLKAVILAIFLGGWDERIEGDKSLIEKWFNAPFEQFRDALQPFSGCDTPLIIRSGTMTTISGAATAFALMVKRMTMGDLEKLEQMAKTVFEEIDPVIEMPPAERYMADFRGKKLSHSSWLRNGLAGTLLRIAVLGEKLEDEGVVPEGLSRQQFVDRIIKTLPGLKKDWRLIVSLRDQLPVLMEAAPRPFLDALEHLLQGDMLGMAVLFQEDRSGMGPSLRSGLLWGLEGLAWDPTLLAKVVMILARMHDHDPGGNDGRRPMDSLRGIFLAWYPGTRATISERLAVLDRLMKQRPEAGQMLLCQLLPSPHQIASPTHMPLWCHSGGFQELSQNEIWEAYDRYIQMAIQLSRNQPEILCCLVKQYDQLSEAHHQKILDILDGLLKSGPDVNIREKVGTVLRKLVGKHTQYGDAVWAMPQTVLGPIRERMEGWVLTDLSTRFDWLFNEELPDSPVPPAPGIEQWDAIDQLRVDAVGALWQEGQWPMLRELINRVPYHSCVVKPMADQLDTPEEGLAIVKELATGSQTEQWFAHAFSGRLRQRFGDRWLDLLSVEAGRQTWTPAYLAGLCYYFPDSRQQMDWIFSLGDEVATFYWRRKEPYINRESGLDPDWVVTQFLRVGLSRRAVQYAYRVRSALPPERVMDLLQACVETAGEQPDINNYYYEIGKLFSWLHQQNGIEISRLMTLEYAFLPLLVRPSWDKDGTPLALHRGLAQDPALFMQVICHVYKARSDEGRDKPLSQQDDQHAQLGWELLRSWRTPPGIGDDGSVDEQLLRTWVDRTRIMAQEQDRLGVVDGEIGKVLRHFPADPEDTFWPHRALRILLENLQNPDIERAILTETHNARGVTSRAIYEGGKQERQLAAFWRRQANAIGHRWPRTMAMLGEIADSWEKEAKWYDTQAEQDRLRDGSA